MSDKFYGGPWRPGMTPSAVNDQVRRLMASLPKETSRYYKIKLIGTDGRVVSEKVLRVYPKEIEHGDKWARMQGAMLGQELGFDAMHDAKKGAS